MQGVFVLYREINNDSKMGVNKANLLPWVMGLGVGLLDYRAGAGGQPGKSPIDWFDMSMTLLGGLAIFSTEWS